MTFPDHESQRQCRYEIDSSHSYQWWDLDMGEIWTRGENRTGNIWQGVQGQTQGDWQRLGHEGHQQRKGKKVNVEKILGQKNTTRIVWSLDTCVEVTCFDIEIRNRKICVIGKQLKSQVIKIRLFGKASDCSLK